MPTDLRNRPIHKKLTNWHMATTDRPNLLLFMPDQLRADSVGAFGNPIVQTPNIDALAARGTIFPNAYGQHTVCSQSRVSMFTGWYPHVAGHRTLTHLLQPHEPNVFRSLREGGYHVAFAGARGDMMGPGAAKASTDRQGWTRPPRRSDLSFVRGSVYGEDHKWFYAFYDGLIDNEPFDLDEATVQTAIDWITDGMPEPWCLFVPLIYPHPPFAVHEPWFSMHDRADVPSPTPPTFDGKPGFYREIHERYGLGRLDDADWREIVATYYGMVSRVDAQLGAVVESVDRAGATDSTVTMFFTDHGEYLGDYGLVEKWMSGLDDCLTRNPLIIADPRARSGQVHESFVEMVDLTATLEDFAGLERSYTHMGRTLRPLLEDASRTHRDAAFSEGGFMLDEEPLLESGSHGHYRHKQELQHDETALAGRAISVRTAGWTYVERLYEGPELYDRVNDPGETTNLAADAAQVEICAQHKERIFGWLFETSDVIPWQQDARMDRSLFANMMDD